MKNCALTPWNCPLLPLLLAVMMPSWAPAQTLEWAFPTETPPNAVTFYPDTVNPTGVALGNGSEILLIQGDGTVMKRFSTDGNAGRVAVADLDGDGAPEFLTDLSPGGIVACYSNDGHEQWRYATDSQNSGFNNVIAADVHPSEGLEVIAGFQDGWLLCLSAQGDLLWRFYGDRFRVGQPAVGDIDADGPPEIVYGTDNGRVYCLTGYGEVKWRFEEMAPYGRSGPNLADLDGDGKSEVLITRSNVNNNTCLIALDHEGKLLWRTQDIMQGYVSNATADLDGDGTLEVFHCDKGNHVYCENHDGTRRWVTEVEGKGIFWAPAIGDLDGDGAMEIVVGARGKDPHVNTYAYVLAADGTVKHALDIDGDSNASPAIGDIDGDGQLELLVGQKAYADTPNRLLCLTWNAAGRIGWPSIRANSSMTGADASTPMGRPGAPLAKAQTSEARIDATNVFFGDNAWKVSWPQPTPTGAFLEITTLSEDGRREMRIQDVKEGCTSTDLTCTLSAQGKLNVTVRLMANGFLQPLASAQTTVAPKAPDFYEAPTVEQAVTTALAAGERAGADTSGLPIQLLALQAAQQQVASMQSQATSQELAKAATNLRKRADDLTRKAQALRTLWEQKDTGLFVVWNDENPWDDFDPQTVPESIPTWPTIDHLYGPEAPKEPKRPANPIHIQAFQNEFENVALNVLNTTGRTLCIRASFQRPARVEWRSAGPVPEDVQEATLHHLLPVTPIWGEIVYDILPPLDDSQVLVVAPGETRQLWITFKTHGLEPGTHPVTLYLGTLAERERLTFREVPIDLEIWPVALPTDTYQLMNWTNLEPATNSDQAIQNMINHGMSVAYGPGLPAVPVDAQGQYTGEPIDWTHFDECIARVPDNWTFLWTSHPHPRFPEGIAPADRNTPGYPDWLEGDLYFQGVKSAIAVMVDHLESLEIGYDRWGFYPIDEPWNTGFTHIPELRRFCSLTKKADPNVRNYTDPAGLVRVQYIEEFKNLIDIWQPELNTLKRDPDLTEWFRENAETFWFYEAPGPARDLKPLGHYRNFAWLAWRLGTQGHGFWVFKWSDMWWSRETVAYGAVYMNKNDVVTNRRWEASRDGIEDWRAFSILTDEIERAEAAGNTKQAGAARALLDEAIHAVTDYHFYHIDEITRATRDYEIDYQTLMRYRARIAEEIIKLKAL